jgi:glycosyltransferase involved in cell wall biosynthesis
MNALAKLHAVTHPAASKAGQIVGWRLAVPLLRACARRRLDQLEPGTATIVTVNWNSWPFLEVLLDLVARRSAPGTRVIVVDNGSSDGSRRQITARPDARGLLLPANVGHELALDLGVLLCRTEFVVALDIDAFPLHDDWLERLLAPLDEGAQISGARLNREYVHPCCWAMRTRRFVEQAHSFRAHYRPREGDRDASGDVGEEMSAAEAPHLRFFEVTNQRGPGDVGTIFGDLVYHNFYSTRFNATAATTLDEVVEAGEPERAWEEALRRYTR